MFEMHLGSGCVAFPSEIEGAKIVPNAARCDEAVEITDEIVFQGVGETDMDILLL